MDTAVLWKTQVGISYILFIMALWLAVISEMFASRIRVNGAAGHIEFPRFFALMFFNLLDEV